MNRKNFLNLIVALILFVCSFCYAINLLYRFIKPNYQTEIVYDFSYSNVINSKAVFIRDEQPIISEINGYPYYLVKDGSAVSKKTAIAKIYPSKNEVELSKKLDLIENSIEIIKNILSKTEIGNDNIEIEKEINKYLLNSLDVNSLYTVEDVKLYLQYYLSAKTLSSFEYNSLDYQLKILKDEYEKINNLIPDKGDVVYSISDGYFSSFYDGFENILSYNLDKMDFGKIEEIISKNNVSDNTSESLGKIILSHKSYIIIPIAENEKSLFKKNSNEYVLNFNNSQKISVKLINIIRNNDCFYAITMCENINDFIINTRISDVSIVLNSYSGYKISCSSLRNYLGDNGVFVKTGNLIEFKPVEVLYKGQNYYIVSSNFLKQYDEIIIEGQDLYNGKII